MASSSSDDARLTRNLCIIAHVDHGKTTMADSLLASNGLVSHRLAGLGLRYMDSRDDEQDRGITMKASCIALAYDSGGENGVGRSAVNLIDSPGHVDFCSEVSAATRLSDGALLVVDAVEGVCVQTHAVLKQAWEEHVVPVLVLNKIDRLITELELSPLEAWHHLKNVVEQVNAIAGHLHMGAVLAADRSAHADAAAPSAESTDAATDITDADADVAPSDLEALQAAVGELHFAPEKGNVLFASAMHGWGFSLHDFASLYESKIGMKKEVLMQTLWGEYFFNTKQKKIVRSSNGGKFKPMFVQFVLSTLWHVYTAVITSPDEAQRTKIVSTLGLEVPPRELKHTDPIVQLRAIMGLWLPLGRNVLRAVVEHLPNARDAQAARLKHMCPPLHAAAEDEEEEYVDVGGGSALTSLSRHVSTCDPSGPVVLHVAKMVYAAGVHGAHPDDIFVGFARVFCGTLKPGSGGVLHVLHEDGGSSSQQDESNGGSITVEIDSIRLYVLMGRELIPTSEVGAGAVCGIGGLGNTVGKSATLCTEAVCPPFAALATQSAPIVQVAVEPTNLSQMSELEKGLQLLGRADWSVEVKQLPSGEHVLGTCGEVHLERCIHDLNNSFAVGVPLSVSAPIVPLRESVASESVGRSEVSTTSRQCKLNVRAISLTEGVRECLEAERNSLRSSLHAGGGGWLPSSGGGATDGGPLSSLPSAVSCLLNAMDQEGGKQWKDGLVPLSAAPFATLDNLLLCTPEVATLLQGGASPPFETSLLHSVLTGFQLAVGSGPLCEEPMSGVVMIIDDLSALEEEDDGSGGGGGGAAAGQLEGQMIVATKDACRNAMLQCSCRVLEPVYLCELQTTQDSMGRTYGVLAKRRAQVLSEDLKEGTPIFIVRSHLPVVESFGFAQELRKNTSGAAHPQLVFSHFEPLQQDPNFVVATEEEQENLDGGDYDGVNLARRIVDDVRRRKGLRVEEKAVKVATKQRTMTKMK